MSTYHWIYNIFLRITNNIICVVPKIFIIIVKNVFIYFSQHSLILSSPSEHTHFSRWNLKPRFRLQTTVRWEKHNWAAAAVVSVQNKYHSCVCNKGGLDLEKVCVSRINPKKILEWIHIFGLEMTRNVRKECYQLFIDKICWKN